MKTPGHEVAHTRRNLERHSRIRAANDSRGTRNAEKKTPPKPTATKAKILTDPDGQRYTLKRLRKKDIRYHKRADGSVRILPYFLYQLVREDTEYLYVKEYLVPKGEAAAPPHASSLPAVVPPPTPLLPVC